VRKILEGLEKLRTWMPGKKEPPGAFFHRGIISRAERRFGISIGQNTELEVFVEKALRKAGFKSEASLNPVLFQRGEEKGQGFLRRQSRERPPNAGVRATLTTRIRRTCRLPRNARSSTSSRGERPRVPKADVGPGEAPWSRPMCLSVASSGQAGAGAGLEAGRLRHSERPGSSSCLDRR
jgi:hypothetical protein